jgi:predicted nucleic-acid-binding protein
VRITVDTDILVRAVVRDDERQAQAAATPLREAEVIAVTRPCLCEFVWVLRRVYGLAPNDIATALETVLNTGNMVVNRPAAEAGLAILRAGDDFAGGLIAYEGAWLGGDTLVSFDGRAVSLIAGQGQEARLLV